MRNTGPKFFRKIFQSPVIMWNFEQLLQRMPSGATRVSKAPTRKPAKAAKKTAVPKRAAKPRLLSGDNPQIAKAYGDAPVQAYIAAIPGWKRDIPRRLDAVVTRAVPGVR